MRRLHVHVEGQTEEGFVNRVLLPHLVGGFGYAIVSARLLGNPRSRLRRGGIRSWASVRKEIIRHLQTDREALATTMVDYYGLPDTWPGRDASMQAPFVEKAAVVERGLRDDVTAAQGGGRRRCGRGAAEGDGDGRSVREFARHRTSRLSHYRGGGRARRYPNGGRCSLRPSNAPPRY